MKVAARVDYVPSSRLGFAGGSRRWGLCSSANGDYGVLGSMAASFAPGGPW